MNNTFTQSDKLLSRLKSGDLIYFAGIGGVSMSGLAMLARTRGYRVAGCDRNLTSEAVERLRLDHVPIDEEETANPVGASLVVYTLAIRETSPAISYARAHNIPIVSRADFLGAMTYTFPCRIAVAGMHGKSTTVGMLNAILMHAGADPTVLSGAPLTPGGDCYRIGGSRICLAEACEYRNSFLALRPTHGVVTNIELDHPDFFATIGDVEESFSHFLWNCDTAVVGGDCPALHALADPAVTRFGFGNNCSLRGERKGQDLTIYENNIRLGSLSLSVCGDYNCENALAATATARALGIPFNSIAEALSAFRGVGRRMENVGTIPTSDGGTATVLLDYAHHPTELTACIKATKESGRVRAVFQPHTYTRTRALWNDFISALRLADDMILTDIYAAREAALDGTSSSRLAASAGVKYAPSLEIAASYLLTSAQNGDIILILGAGDIDRLVSHLIK